MCEKNFTGKALSPPSDSEERRVSPSSDDIDESYPKDWKPVKSRGKKKGSSKKVTKKICKTCGEDIIANEDRNVYRYLDTYAQLRAKEYCENHETQYSNHKCKPCWCGDCGFLTKYEIEIEVQKRK